ncbi:MAG: PAS domain S-box protein [Arcobacteraceae bacterium]|nr:PAS domain S-box protein [Arcobacteraceae bacterium]
MYNTKEHRVEEFQREKLKHFELNIIQEYQTSSNLMSFLFALILKDKFIQKNLYNFYRSDIQTQAKIREDIYTKLLPTYEEFMKISFKQIHIHLKDNKSFLRMHKKDMFGDDLTQLRPMVRYVNEHKIDISGFEIGRMNDGFRYIRPLFYNNQHVGSIEYVLSSQYQINHMKEAATNKISFILKENEKIANIDKEYKNKYKKIDKLNGFVMTTSLFNENKMMCDAIDNLSKEDVEIINKSLAQNESFNVVVYQNFQYKLFQFVPQKIALGDKIGGYYIYLDDATYLDEMTKDFHMMTVVVYVILVLIFYFLYYQSETKEILKRKNKERQDSWKIVDKYVIFSQTDIRGIITDVSSAFCDISGYTKEELIGNSHRIIRHPDTQKEYFEQLWTALNENKTWIGLVKNQNKMGEKYWIKTFIEPLFDDQENKIGYKNIAVDVTDAKALEKINKTLNKKIRKAVKLNMMQYKKRQEEQLQNMKLSSIGSLAAGITHEINTPLTYMKGNFEMMKYDIMDLENNDSLKESLLLNHTRIFDGIRRISNIIEAMRELASTTKDDVKVETNVYSSLMTALTMVHNKSKQIAKIYINGTLFDINMDNSICCDCKVFVHKQRIEQVWIVIINNAIDELIKIEDYENRKLSIMIEDIEDKVMVYFKDNAGGIDEKILLNLFDPFISTKESGGMGLGLNIAKKIIDSNNGKIEAYNENNGAVFKVTLSKK